ncbi:MAG: electron transfer flavoprotein subunit beta, partial [Candidatus Bathyarchaeota archaeon]
MPRMVVCLKQAIDVAELRVDLTTQRPNISDAPRKISDFDKNALEAAVKLKETLGGEVIVVSVGILDAKLVLREALAMGADRAYLMSDPSFEHSDTLATSRILAIGIAKLGDYDLILCGEASIDSYSGQIGPRLAER